MKADSIQELLDWQPPAVVELIGGGLLHPGSRAVVFGRWGSWKSMLCMHLGFCLSKGRPWLGFQTTKTSVLMAQVEIPKYKFRERVEKYVNHDGPGGENPEEFRVLTEPFLRLDKAQVFYQFRDMVRDLRPQVIILDPFYRLYSGDISNNYEIQSLMDKLDVLALEMNIALVIVGHTRKPKEDKPVTDWGNELIGGSYIMDWVDTAIALELAKDTDIQVHFVKVRHATDEMLPFTARVNRGTLHFQRMV